MKTRCVLLFLSLFFWSQMVFAETPTSPIAAENEAVFNAFSSYARAEKRERLLGETVGALSGGMVMGLGAALASDAGLSTTPWYAVGGTITGLSLLSLLVPSEAESLARRHELGRRSHTRAEADALEKAWATHARQAKTARLFEAGFGTLISLGSATAGALVLSQNESLSDSGRRLVGGVLLGFGVSGTAGSVAHFFRRSRAEESYELYAATQGAPSVAGSPWRWGLSAVPGGAGLRLSSSF